jgi:methyl-accepting chemotaxis protein
MRQHPDQQTRQRQEPDRPFVIPIGVPFVQLNDGTCASGGRLCLLLIRESRPGRLTQIAYVALIRGTDILIGTGVYVDSIEATRAALSQKIGAKQSRYAVRIAILFALVLAVLVALAIFVANTVTGSVRSTVEQLLNGSQQVADASARLSSQSQNLAQGASEQAQKIEEATAALEQMAEVTTRNIETAGKTDEVAKLAHAAATRGAADIGETSRRRSAT